jgi:hypothetical protein
MNKTVPDATPLRDMDWGELNVGAGRRWWGKAVRRRPRRPVGPGNCIKPDFSGLALAFCIMHDIGAADL